MGERENQFYMKPGKFYGIGVGPGDPELVTMKAARVLRECRHVFVPKARSSADSVALSIASGYLGPHSEVKELLFPMTSDQGELSRRWEESARQIAAVLREGKDSCFLTLGDPLLYSTYIYLLRALKAEIPEAEIVTVPGVTAFSAAAALTHFPVGEGKEPVTIIPTADDLENVEEAVSSGGTVILMKIGRRLKDILLLLEKAGVIDRSVFVAHAGMENQRVETDLRSLQAESAETGYLSIILVHAGQEGDKK